MAQEILNFKFLQENYHIDIIKIIFMINLSKSLNRNRYLLKMTEEVINQRKKRKLHTLK